MVIHIRGVETGAQNVASSNEYGNVQSFIILFTTLCDMFLTAHVENGRRQSYRNVKKLLIKVTLGITENLRFLF